MCMFRVGFFVTALLICIGLVQPAAAAKQFIFPAQDEHCHGSTIVALPNGDLLAAWFQGSGERQADDVRILGARLPKGADTWGPVFEMADTPGLPDCNPVLFLDAQERVWLFWVAVMANQWETSLLKYRRADTWEGGGAPAWDWQDTIVLKPGGGFAGKIAAGFEAIGYDQDMWAEYALPYDRQLVEAAQDKTKRRMGWMTRCHVHTLPSGRIVLPLYSDGFNLGLIAYSDDDGATWQASAPIVGLGPIQPAIVRKSDGTLVAYCRDSGPDPRRALVATSTDQGETWSTATDTELAASSASVQIRALEDGRWLFVHNDTEEGRHRLALSVSKNEGATWEVARYLEDKPADSGSFAYPSIIQAADGVVHITYSHHTPSGRTIAHVALSPETIEER